MNSGTYEVIPENRDVNGIELEKMRTLAFNRKNCGVQLENMRR